MSKTINNKPEAILKRMRELIQDENSFTPGRRNTDCMTLSVNMAHYIAAVPHSELIMFGPEVTEGEFFLSDWCLRAIELWEPSEGSVKKRSDEAGWANYILAELTLTCNWAENNIL